MLWVNPRSSVQQPAHATVHKMPAAPPSNLGGHVLTHKGIKEWHAKGREPAHHAYYTTQHKGVEYVHVKAHAPRLGVRADRPKMGVRIRASDPDAPNAAERGKWGAAQSDYRVPVSKRMKGEYERESDGRLRVRPEMHHDVLGNYEERTWSESKDAIIERAEENFLKHESPRAVHDCGITPLCLAFFFAAFLLLSRLPQEASTHRRTPFPAPRPCKITSPRVPAQGSRRSLAAADRGVRALAWRTRA